MVTGSLFGHVCMKCIGLRIKNEISYAEGIEYLINRIRKGCWEEGEECFHAETLVLFFRLSSSNSFSPLLNKLTTAPVTRSIRHNRLSFVLMPSVSLSAFHPLEF